MLLDTSVVTNWKFEETKLLGCGNFGIVSYYCSKIALGMFFFVYLLLHTQVFKGHCQDTGRELAVKIVRDLNEKVDE